MSTPLDNSLLLQQIRAQQLAELGELPSAAETSKIRFQKETGLGIQIFASLQKIPPNTDIHYSNNLKKFIITAPDLHFIPGAQKAANWVKNHDCEDVADRLHFIATTLKAQAEDLESFSDELKPLFYRKLYRLRTEFTAALAGKIPEGGLNGVVKTYEGKANMKAELTDIIDEINRLLPSLEVLEQKIGPWVKAPGYCVEADFSDEEWDELCEESISHPADVTLQNYTSHTVRLAYNQVANFCNPENHKWWNKIDCNTQENETNIYLGALPIQTPLQDSLQQLQEEKIAAVLSVVEPFENHSAGLFTSAITPAQFKEAKIKQLQIPISDCETGSLNDLQRGAEFIHWNIRHQRSVYIHCEAGTGRSTLMVAAYLIKYKGLTAQQALDLIKRNRPQAEFCENDPKKTTLIQYENLLLRQKLQQIETA